MRSPQRKVLEREVARNHAQFHGGTLPAEAGSMLAFCNSEDLVQLLRHTVRRAGRTRSVAIASAFVDATGLAWLQTLDRTSKAPIYVATRPEAAALLRRVRWRNTRVASVPGLHAKAYAVVGRRDEDSEAFVGSPNLTGAGLADNIEAGIRITGSTPDHAALVRRVAWWIRNVSRRPQHVVG